MPSRLRRGSREVRTAAAGTSEMMVSWIQGQMVVAWILGAAVGAGGKWSDLDWNL